MTAPIFMVPGLRNHSSMAGLWRFFRLWEPPRDSVVVPSSNEETTMNAIRSTVALATLAVGVAACSVNDGYYAPRSQATYYPARTTTYYSYPATTTYYSYPAATYYTYDPPSYQKSNVYSSRWDYYRNYQGIHNGPERTGP
jgi:hypothetical protein